MTVPQDSPIIRADAIIVGGGFSGIYVFHRLRDQLGLNVKIIEAGSDLGGVWHRNVYPGARVDSPSPVYAFGMEEVHKTWNWSQAYPGQKELQAYFQHVDQVLSIKKDCIFNTRVNAASFDPETAKWTIRTEDGKTAVAKYFVPAIGFAAQEHIPDWKGIDSFKGTIHHSSHWPREGVDVKGKSVAVVGTGATAVQIIQEWAKEAGELFVFQRTPNFALPMNQKHFSPAEQKQMAAETAGLFSVSKETISGMPFHAPTKAFADFTREEAVELLNQLYDRGGFGLWGGSYVDVLLNPEGNRCTYDVWAKRTRERIHDPVKRDLLAPLDPPHPFGGKRPSLEQDYYEQFNRPNVHIVDTKSHPIVELTPAGIVTDAGKRYDVDVIAIATGFDSSTGGLFKMGIKDINGVELAERWKNGVSTHLGMMVPGFPNMFMPYGLQSPTPFTNGPVFIEHQANFIRDLVQKMQTESIRSIDPLPAAAEAWKAEVKAVGDMTLFSQAKSWYIGANIPGKTVEMLYYFGGIIRYREVCAEALGPKFGKSFACH